MSEHVHVHAPHELSEQHGGSTSRRERVLELVATLLLAFATVSIAWSGYQGARWSGRQAREYAQANTARSLANRAEADANEERIQDLINFNRWLDAETSNDTILADRYALAFRAEFLPPFEAWLAQDPRNNPAAAATPLQMPEYRVADREKSNRLEREGTEHFELGKDATENTDSYVLTTVFLATVLFFAGISMRFEWLRMRIVVLALGTISLVYAIVMLATLPTL